MRRAVNRSITFLIAFLIAFRIIGACVAAVPPIPEGVEVISAHDQTSFILLSFSVEKTESEIESHLSEDTIGRCLLIDFSQQAISLSTCHTPQPVLEPSTLRYDVRPPVHQFNCVFQI